MSDHSTSEGSDDEYGPIANSWGDQAKTEAPAGNWASLENPNAKLGPSGLGSGDLHRKGRNYKPVDETVILNQRLKKANAKAEQAAARQQRRGSSRGRGRKPSSLASRPRSTVSRPSHTPLRRSSTTTVNDRPQKTSLSEHRQTAPWEELSKPKKPSVRFSQPLECPPPTTMHSPKTKPVEKNLWANKPLMEEPFWNEPVKPEEPAVESKPSMDEQPAVLEERLVEEMEPQPSSHLELATWSSGGVLTPSLVATPTKRTDPAPWDSPQADNWLDTFTPVETITPPETTPPPEPRTPECEPSPTKEPANSPVATPTSDSSWPSSTTNDTSVDDAWDDKKPRSTSSWDSSSQSNPLNASNDTTRSKTESNGPPPNASSNTTQTNTGSRDSPSEKTNTDSWNPSSDAQNNNADAWDSPSATKKSSSADARGSTQANDAWRNNSKAQNRNSNSWGSTESNAKRTWNSTVPSAKDASGSTDSSAKNTCGSPNSSWKNNNRGWPDSTADSNDWKHATAESNNWANTTVDNGWGSTTPTEKPKEPSRFSRSDRPKYSTRPKGPLPANYSNKPLSPPTKVAPPSRVDNPILVTVNVGISDDKNIPVHIHLYDDPQSLARQFARENAIQSPNIIDAVHKLFANQKAMAMKKRSRPVNTSSRYNHPPHRNPRYSNV